MNTPAHLIFGLAAFGKPDAPKVTAAALIGATMPDLSLYVMAGVSLFVLGLSPQVVFDELYFSDAWQLVFKIDNSAVLWGLGLAYAIWRKSAWGVALCGAALLHIGLDFPLHHDDGRAHFWPISNWVFESPVSYWDRRHYAGIVAPIEAVAVLVASLFLLRKFVSLPIRALVLVLAGAQLLPGIMWMFVFQP